MDTVVKSGARVASLVESGAVRRSRAVHGVADELLEHSAKTAMTVEVSIDATRGEL